MTRQSLGARCFGRVECEYRGVSAGEICEDRMSWFVRGIVNRRMRAVDVENEYRSLRADKLSLLRVGPASVQATLKQVRVTMGSRHDTCSAVLCGEVNQRADHVARVPHTWQALSTPVNVQCLLAVPRSKSP